jgi:hypothetical protein
MASNVYAQLHIGVTIHLLLLHTIADLHILYVHIERVVKPPRKAHGSNSMY